MIKIVLNYLCTYVLWTDDTWSSNLATQIAPEHGDWQCTSYSWMLTVFWCPTGANIWPSYTMIPAYYNWKLLFIPLVDSYLSLFPKTRLHMLPLTDTLSSQQHFHIKYLFILRLIFNSVIHFSDFFGSEPSHHIVPHPQSWNM